MRLPHVALSTPLLAGLALAVAAPSPAGAALRSPQPLSLERGDTPIDGWAGWIVWSRRNDDGTYGLIARRPEGAAAELPLPRQRRPFDARVGPGPDGGPLVVVSRCATLSGERPTGCDVWRVDPRTGATSPVASASRPDVDERSPAVWGSRIAFQREVRPGDPSRTAIAVAPLDGSAPARTTIAGPRHERRGGRRVAAASYGPGALDLHDRRLAFTWRVEGRKTRWSLRTARTNGAGARGLLEVAPTRRTLAVLGAPALDRGEVVVPALRSGGGARSTLFRATTSGSRAWTLGSGFSAAQAERYGSAISAVALTGDGRMAVVRRLASDGRFGCRSAVVPGTEGCELLSVRIADQRWRRVR